MKYMILVTFDHSNEDAFNATVPAEQAHVQRMKEKGVIEGIYVSLDGSKGWTIMNGESPEYIAQTLKTFPLYPYMSTEVIQLFDEKNM